MKKLLLVFFILPLLTTCEMFDNDMPAFLDFYTGAVKIESHSADVSYTDGESGIMHISPPSGEEESRTITFALNNPQKYGLKPNITWSDSLLPIPAPATDYTLEQDPDDKSLIRLILTKEFLDKTDKAVNGGDISATINLTEPESGRAFEPYDKLILESNSPPPAFKSEDVFLMEEKTGGGKYVLCFKLPHVISSDMTHQDIKTLKIIDNGKVISTYDINFTGDKHGENAVIKDSKIIKYTSTDLSSVVDGLAPGSAYYTDEDVIFYNTGLNSGGSINYTVTLTDDKGLSSEVVISSEPPTVGGTIEATINLVSGTVLHEGEYYTKNNFVTLRLSAVTDNVSGITGYRTTNSSSRPAADAKWQNWNGNSSADSPTHPLDKIDTDGAKYIYVWIKDATGNISVATIVKVTLATKTPAIRVTINEEPGTVIYGEGKKCHTTNNTITLRLTSTTSGRGVTGYQIIKKAEPPAANTGAWEPWNGNSPINSLPYVLGTVRPEKIYAWVKDAIGNVFPAGVEDEAGERYVEVTSLVEKVVNVYLNPIDGNDTNSGTASDKAVKTMAKAIHILGGTSSALASNATILIMSTITVVNNETWSVATPLTIKNYPSFTGQMVAVTGGTLKLKNIIIDGEGKRRTTPLVKVTGSTLNLENGVILQNNDSTANGGGVYVANGSTLKMSGTAQITKNYTRKMGGGVYVANGSTLKMSGTAQISYNNANKDGGGIYFIENTTTNNILNMSENAHISYNEALDNGGGVWLENKVNSNTAANTSILEMSGAAHISNNKAIYGGGLWLNNTVMKSNIDSSILNMIENAHISDNEATKDGGGVWNSILITMGENTICRLTMGGSTQINGNSAVSGGGMYTRHFDGDHDGTKKNHIVFKMDVLAQISGNSATLYGGGVFYSSDFNYPDFDMSGATQISDNSADTGGGIYMTSKDHMNGSGYEIVSLNMTGIAQINRNTAKSDGGGVYMSTPNPVTNIKLSLSDDNLITDNKAGGIGGGVYLQKGPWLVPTIAGSRGQITGNTADGATDPDDSSNNIFQSR